jgi:protein Tex
MTAELIRVIAVQLNIAAESVKKTVALLNESATVPFIARYRKEATGGLDEMQIEAIKKEHLLLQELVKRKATILKAIEEQGKLTDALKKAIESTYSATELEDIYLPFKQKRKTKAEIARKNGLEKLATIIFEQRQLNIESIAKEYINSTVTTVEEAISGAQDIIAEWVNENVSARNSIRKEFENNAVISSKLVKSKAEEAEKFKDYFDFEERLNKCKSHRLLAIRRGENEGFLKVSIHASEDRCVETLNRIFVKNKNLPYVAEAVKDAYKRLLAPSIENEFAAQAKEIADKEAIHVFSENLRQLLLGAPLGKKRILAIDPGFKSGCKVVCLDEKGDLLHNENIFPHAPQNERTQAMKKISSLIDAYKIEAIAIGNGTAGRETESLIRSMRFQKDVEVYIVSEAGASVYSASKVARDEFPQYDVTVRGSVSIGRRLMDPLAELVKIEPKSIGVGQYQHDVDQKMLQQSLDAVVESCVNKVGVDVNTASKHLLTYVSGLGEQLAQNVVDYRKENGTFKTRNELKKVPRMGAKAFEQCAGFLRIKDGENPLDNSAVHPESYDVVNQMAKDLNTTIDKLIQNTELVERINLSKYMNTERGEETLKDIKAELLKPGLDPRKKAKMFEFAKGVNKISDLHKDMVLPGIVTNITNFGAFVDIGVKQDGLVHISNLANEYISNPADYLQLHQHVKVKVVEVDEARKRIGLSMKDV